MATKNTKLTKNEPKSRGGKLTEKQERFVEGKLNGLNNTQAAIHAGYPSSSAAVQANSLLRNPKVMAALDEAGWEASTPTEEEQADKYGMRTDYTSSLDLLQHTYNNPRMSASMRMQAAIQALPYEHGKVGDVGKKEKRQEKAEKMAAGSNFQAGRPPKGRPQLRAVES